MRWMMRSRPQGEHGVTTVVVAVLLSAFLLGLGAIVTDVGSWYSQRAQLQNGADAGALAVAQSCAGTSGCITTAADKYAPDNHNGTLDTSAKVTTGFPCGNSGSASPGLPACPAGTEDGTYCPKPPASGNYVNVHVENSSRVPAILGKLLDKNDNGKTILACGQARWGSFGGGSGLALTMSLCAWQAATGGVANPVYATPAPPYTTNPWPTGYTATVNNKNPVTPNVGGENVVQIHGKAKPCNDSSSGLNIPGGFAWLSNSSNGSEPANCVVQTTADGYIYNNPGGLGGKQSECAKALTTIYNASTPIPNAHNPFFIPVFDLACASNGTLDPSGGPCPAGMPNNSYHIAGYATFVLTGYDVSPISAKSMITGKNVCKGNFDCVYGMFTKGLVQSTGEISDGNDYGGPTVVKLSG